MINRFDKEVFSNIYYLKNGLNVELFKVLILLNKFYPSYTYIKGSLSIDNVNDECIKWEDIILKEVQLLGNPYLDMYFNVPVFVQEENRIELKYTSENGIGLTIEEDERFGLVFIINIYPNVFLDRNYNSVLDEKTHSWYYIQTEQTLAAKKNRENLACFLEDLESLLQVKIGLYESPVFNSEYIYKYGFRDNVALTLR